MTNLETNFLEVLTREAVHFCSRAVRLFSSPARANACGPYTGLSSMVFAMYNRYLMPFQISDGHTRYMEVPHLPPPPPGGSNCTGTV